MKIYLIAVYHFIKYKHLGLNSAFSASNCNFSFLGGLFYHFFLLHSVFSKSLLDLSSQLSHGLQKVWIVILDSMFTKFLLGLSSQLSCGLQKVWTVLLYCVLTKFLLGLSLSNGLHEQCDKCFRFAFTPVHHEIMK